MTETIHHVGVDEAGLGPNLGPLVVVATRWSGPACSTDELWNVLEDAVTQQADGVKLHIGDSKAVYKNKSDFGTLERSARGVLAAAGVTAGGLDRLVETLDPAADLANVPWLQGVDDGPSEAADSVLARTLQEQGFSLSVAAAFVTAERFNTQLSVAASKGDLLSRTSLATLRQVWSPQDEATSVWCDKHGGRNRYDDLLLDCCDGAFVIRHEEAREASRYTVENSSIVFGVRSERHFPVACASLVAKYLRQRAMRAFNTWWRERVPDIRPTEGYPQDAKRFRADVAAVRTTLDLSDNVFWRAK